MNTEGFLNSNEGYTYKFTAGNQLVFNVTLLATILCYCFLVSVITESFRQIEFIYLMLINILLIVSIFPVIRMAAFARVQISLSEEAVHIKYLQRFLFNNQPDRSISFKQIISYIDQSDYNWNWIKIKLDDGTRIKVAQFKSSGIIEFNQFIRDFTNFIKEYNNKLKNHKQDTAILSRQARITLEKAVYESAGGLLLFAAMVVAALYFTYDLIFTLSAKPPSRYKLLILYFYIIIHFLQILIYRKRRKADQK